MKKSVSKSAIETTSKKADEPLNIGVDNSSCVSGEDAGQPGGVQFSTSRKTGPGKLCIYTRDELVYIDIKSIAYIKANGNCVEVIYITSTKFHLNCSISQMFATLSSSIYSENVFIKLGRSLIINYQYLQKILPLKTQLILSDNLKNTLTLSLPKKTLRKLHKALLLKDIT